MGTVKQQHQSLNRFLLRRKDSSFSSKYQLSAMQGKSLSTTEMPLRPSKKWEQQFQKDRLKKEINGQKLSHIHK
jgi:hypothetical protein